MPVDEIMASRKTRVFSQMGHVHNRKLLTPERQIHPEQGKRLMTTAKTAAMNSKASALRVTGLPSLHHYDALLSKAEEIEMNRQQQEEAETMEIEPAPAEEGDDLFARLGNPAGGEEQQEHGKRREAPTLNLNQLMESDVPPKKKPKQGSKKAVSRQSSQHEEAKTAQIANLAAEEQQQLRETDPQMHLIAECLQTCPDCLPKLRVSSVFEGSAIGNSIWSARERILPKLQGKKEYDILSRRLAECEAASKLTSKGGLLKLPKSELQQVLVVLNDMDNFQLPLSLRLQLMERRGFDLLEEVVNLSDESKWKARARDFATTLVPAVTENLGFDLFCVTCSALMHDEKVRQDALNWLGSKAESGEALVYKDGFGD
ncbi:unnamed protein product [Symbiodinium necroappetens]|uniref:Uncharacterized protein n=1 Tax=Symbiodinium necroappetens TaxID=1628268 RepID=A0A813CP31_9DINO|nr:unnamed protein product [Symbiodinium necroappetens]